MGNNVSGTSHIAGALDSYVSELGAEVIYEKRQLRVLMPPRRWLNANFIDMSNVIVLANHVF
jgi:hypothetical protein